MHILFLGDIVGKAGRDAVVNVLPKIRARVPLDCVIINGENAAHGFGITEKIAQDVLSAGVDAITLGNHAWDHKEALVFIERMPQLIRPINFPTGTPGRGANLFELKNGQRILIINAMGRIFMDAMDNPFHAVDAAVSACPLGAACDAIVVDFHAETTSEKQSMGALLDGRASLVVGTHTHVPTADYRIQPAGTAYMSDAGMCGDYCSVLGFNKHEPLQRFLTHIRGEKFEPATGEATLSGVAIETGAHGLATRIAPLRIGGVLAPAWPSWWPEL